jgi:hypothetical protein
MRSVGRVGQHAPVPPVLRIALPRETITVQRHVQSRLSGPPGGQDGPCGLLLCRPWKRLARVSDEMSDNGRNAGCHWRPSTDVEGGSSCMDDLQAVAEQCLTPKRSRRTSAPTASAPALEDGRAVFVCGPEHFNEPSTAFACAGAQNHNPLIRRIEGLIGSQLPGRRCCTGPASVAAPAS